MTYKKLAINLTLALAAIPAAALADGNYLHVRTSDGGWKVLDIDLVDKIRFSGGLMTATDADNNVIETFKQDELTTIFYSETSGVKSISGEVADPTFTYDANSAMVVMNADAPFEIYSIAGEKLVEIPETHRGQSIDLSQISGVVILKSGNYNLKAILK